MGRREYPECVVRGLLLNGTIRPARGSYLEVRRGSCVIVGRVVWVEAGRFGVRTQDSLPLDALISTALTAPGGTDDSTSPFSERRARPRSKELEWRYLRSQHLGRVAQTAVIAGFGLLMGLFVFETAGQVLATPLTAVSEHLATTD